MIKVGFVLLSNLSIPAPSTRISVLNLFPFLIAGGIEPIILYEPDKGNETPNVDGLFDKIIDKNISIVYFQKVHGESVIQLTDQLTKKGIKTIYGVCDLVNLKMVQKTNKTIIVTDYLKSLHPKELQQKIHVVHDGIECPEIVKDPCNNLVASRANPLNAVLVTSVNLAELPVLSSIPNWLKITIVGRYPKPFIKRVRGYYWTFTSQQTAKEKYKYIKFLLNRRIKRVSWDPVTVYHEMKSADIGIIPIDQNKSHENGILPPSWKVKSENRLTMKMALSLPVIASTIPSYMSIIKQGNNGFLAKSEHEWLACLEALKEPKKRNEIGKCAREYAIKYYSMDEQARLFIKVIHSLI